MSQSIDTLAQETGKSSKQKTFLDNDFERIKFKKLNF